MTPLYLNSSEIELKSASLGRLPVHNNQYKASGNGSSPPSAF